jgi:hypothetical protein
LADNFLPISIDLQVTGSILGKHLQLKGVKRLQSQTLSIQGNSLHDGRAKAGPSDKVRAGCIIKPKKKLGGSKLRIGKGQLLSCEEPGELMDLLQDHEIPFTKEEISDSGVSSFGNKPSTSSSDNNSPCESSTSPAPTTSTPSAENAVGHFSFQGIPKGKPRKPQRNVDLLDPAPMPYPSLGDKAEYMILTPEIRPRKPPPSVPGMDLDPQVEIYQVSGNGEREGEAGFVKKV